MKRYWKPRHRPAAPAAPSHRRSRSTYDEHRRTLVKGGSDQEEGWRSELREFLDFVAEDATKDMDIVRWWQVHHLTYIHSFINEEVGSSKAIPHTCKNRIGRSCCPGVLRTLRTAIFLCKTDSE